MSEEVCVIIETDKSKPRTIKLKVPLNCSFASLSEIISASEPIDLETNDFYIENNEQRVRDKSQNIFSLAKEKQKQIYIRPIVYNICLKHLGGSMNLSVYPTDTPSDIRNKFCDQSVHGSEMDRSFTLSYNGKKLEEHKALLDNKSLLRKIDSAHKSSPLILYGKLQIKIMDNETPVNMEIYPFDRIEDIIQSFRDQTKRSKDRAASLLLEDNSELNSKLLFHEIIHSVKSHLTYKADKFRIFIQDNFIPPDPDTGETPRLELEVEEGWTVKEMVKHYQRQYSDKVQFLQKEDSFSHNGTWIEPHSALYRCGIKEGDVICVKRQTIEAANEYICADCGAEIKLKANDVVKCKQCFFRIVFKRRTRKPAQYSCR